MEASLRSQLAAWVSPDSLETVIEYLSTFISDDSAVEDMAQFINEISTQQGSDIAAITTVLRRYNQARRGETAFVEPHIIEIDAAGEVSLEETLKSLRPSEDSKKQSLCGCMATQHAFLTSCIHCGRISCIKEGLGLCYFCSRPLYAPVSTSALEAAGVSDAALLRAYKHKDKLLVFDSENTKRTQVYDAQGDYYESASWLSESERAALDVKEMARRKKLHTRRIATLTLDLQSSLLIESTMSELDKEEEETAVVVAVEAPQCSRTEVRRDEETVAGPEVFSLENHELGAANSRVANVYRALKKRYMRPVFNIET